MPPRQRVFFPEPQAPKLLSRLWIWFFRLLIVFSACAFVTAACGTWVLSDHDKKSWISNTTFADYWRALIAWNQVVNGVTFNGGMFGIMIGFTRLYQHNQAVKQLGHFQSQTLQVQAPPPVDTRSRQEKRQGERAFRKDL